jgi:uncharacterized protein (DUF934 family)
MPLVKQGRITTDPFVHAVDGAELPDDGAILVPAARFLEDPEAVLKRAGKVGVIWPNNRDLDDLVPYLDRLAAVALVFPSFRDGRAYSQARLLRSRYRYKGEVRATGEVLVDMVQLMARTGFDAAVLRADQSLEAAERALSFFAGHYQGDTQDNRPLFAMPPGTADELLRERDFVNQGAAI